MCAALPDEYSIIWTRGGLTTACTRRPVSVPLMYVVWGRRVMPGVRLLWVSEKEVLHDVEKIFCHFISIHTLRLCR